MTPEFRPLTPDQLLTTDGTECNHGADALMPSMLADFTSFLLPHLCAGGQGATPGSAAASLVSSGGGDVGAIGAGSGYGGMDAGMIGPQAMAGMAQPVRG